MKALRSVLVFLWLATTVIPVATMLIISAPFISADHRWWWFAQPWLRAAIAAAKTVGGVKYRVRGLDNLPSQTDNQPIILCPKHQSTWETFFFPSMMPHPLAYVFKRELLYIPFFGWALAVIDMVHIDRSARGEAWNKVARLGAKLMNKGRWIIMFPEGTRTERGSKGVYKTRATRLALATNAKVIPIALSSGRCWPRRSFWLTPGVIDVSIGEPMAPMEGESAVELMARIEEWIEAEMRVIDAGAYSDSDTVTAPTPASNRLADIDTVGGVDPDQHF